MSESVNCTQVDDIRTCLTRLQSVGLALVAEAGFISLTSLTVLLGLIIRNVVRYYKNPPGHKWSLIQEPADAYVLSLFFADMLQSIGAAVDVKWVKLGHVQSGGFCTAQGVLQQLGETSVAIATMVIGLHTFIVVWTGKLKHSIKIALAVIVVSWLFVILFVTISVSTKKNYYNPTPFWCWIGGHFGGERLAGEYVWLWVTLFVSIFVYVPLFLRIRGYIKVEPGHTWKFKWHWSPTRSGMDDLDAQRNSLALLAYPVAYSIVVLPVSVARWASFTGRDTPDAATFFSVFLHNMFGAVNVLLLLMTRPGLLLFTDPRDLRRSRQRESSGRGRAPGGSQSRSPKVSLDTVDGSNGGANDLSDHRHHDGHSRSFSDSISQDPENAGHHQNHHDRTRGGTGYASERSEGGAHLSPTEFSMLHPSHAARGGRGDSDRPQQVMALGRLNDSTESGWHP